MKTYLLIALACLTLSARAQTPAEFRPFITEWEGYAHVPYQKARGERSVGIGHNTAHEGWQAYYTNREIERLYLRDYHRALAAAQDSVFDYGSLPLPAKQVILSVIWTVGANGFTQFYTFRYAIDARDYDAAANALADSLWARQVGPRRLADHLRRLRRLAR